LTASATLPVQETVTRHPSPRMSPVGPDADPAAEGGVGAQPVRTAVAFCRRAAEGGPGRGRAGWPAMSTQARTSSATPAAMASTSAVERAIAAADRDDPDDPDDSGGGGPATAARGRAAATRRERASSPALAG